MKFSSLTRRIVADTPRGTAPIDPWAVHNLAMQRTARGDAITMLSIGQESEERTPEIVVDAAIASLRSGRHHYVDVRGEKHLRQAVAEYHARLTTQSVTAESVTIFTGAQNALFSVAQVLLDIDDELILVAPYYTTYAATFGAPGPAVVIVQVEAEDGYQLNVDRLLDAVTPRTQAIVLNTPNNPLGSHYTQAQIERIVQVCLAKDIWLILDAVYLDTVEAGSVALPHLIPDSERILVTVGSLSKSHRMTGWRVGWVIGPATVAAHLAKLCVCMHYGIPPFIQDAAVVAIHQATGTPETVRSVMQHRRSLLLEHLTTVEPARLIDAGQGMFILLDVEPLGMTAFEFAMGLLEERKVSVLPCDGFGPGGRYLVRIGLCVDGQMLSDAGRKICQFIAENKRTD
ncbi:MAG: pyridoxal phosphate-dependent aminotransferase [Granulosicoccus sp.]|nr:pyridoxal phosphate-dependent aminotransferase [Granulosicoccus sp.]